MGYVNLIKKMMINSIFILTIYFLYQTEYFNKMPAKKSATAAPVAAAAAAPAPVVVSAPAEPPAPVAEKKTRGRKKKEEVAASETEAESSSDEEDGEEIDTVVELIHLTELITRLNKNAKKIDFSNMALYESHGNFLKALQRFEILMETGRNKHMKASAKILEKADKAAEKKEEKKAKKAAAKKDSDESGEDATPKESGVNKMVDIVPEVLAFMGQPADGKLSRADLQRYFNEARTELGKYVVDAEGKNLKGKPFYINEGRIGGLMDVIVKSIKDRGLTAKAIEKGVLDESGNAPAYVQHTYVMKITPFCLA